MTSDFASESLFLVNSESGKAQELPQSAQLMGSNQAGRAAGGQMVRKAVRIVRVAEDLFSV